MGATICRRTTYYISKILLPYLPFPPALLLAKMIGLASVTFCNGETRASHTSQQLSASASHCPKWLLGTSGDASRSWKCMRQQRYAGVTGEEQTSAASAASYSFPAAFKSNRNSNRIRTCYLFLSTLFSFSVIRTRKTVRDGVSSVGSVCCAAGRLSFWPRNLCTYIFQLLQQSPEEKLRSCKHTHKKSLRVTSSISSPCSY